MIIGWIFIFSWLFVPRLTDWAERCRANEAGGANGTDREDGGERTRGRD